MAAVLDWDYLRADFSKNTFLNGLADLLGMEKLEL